MHPDLSWVLVMDKDKFKSEYGWGSLEPWKYLPDLWNEKFINKAELGNRMKKKVIFFDNMHVEIDKPYRKKGHLTLTFKLQLPRKIPEIDAVIEFDKEESAIHGFQGDPMLMDIVINDKRLSTLASDIFQSELIASFRFEVKDIDLLHSKYAMLTMGVGDWRNVPEEKQKDFSKAQNVYLLYKWYASQLCDVKAYVSIVESMDEWLKLFKNENDPSQEFNRILEFLEGIKSELMRQGFEPPIGHRRFMHLESEIGFTVRSEARQRLLGPIKHYLSQKDPLSKETALAINEFYETIQNLFNEWEKRFDWKKFEGKDWTHFRFTGSWGNKRGLVKERFVDKVEEPPWKDIAKRAKKGKRLDELHVAQFLSTILEWLGPGEDLGNADFNVTLDQVRNQLEHHIAIPQNGPSCVVCGTPNQEGFTECYWCHGPL